MKETSAEQQGGKCEPQEEENMEEGWGDLGEKKKKIRGASVIWVWEIKGKHLCKQKNDVVLDEVRLFMYVRLYLLFIRNLFS